jgi:tRNA-Thr(GGU) m(6)t(6)A37 methyltransferase TsaA
MKRTPTSGTATAPQSTASAGGRAPADTQPIRPHEVTLDADLPADATLAFIGHLETPWTRREDCPRQGDREAGPECAVVVAAPWQRALEGVERFATLDILYWLDRSRRDLIVQTPRHGGGARGTFSLRSPIRPNPIGLSTVRLIRREGDRLIVRGLDCVTGTPLIDIKPDRCHFTPAG